MAMDIQYYMKQYEKTISDAKKLFQNGFITKTQQKDCLYDISLAFEYKRKIMQLKILDKAFEYREEHNGKENETLMSLYYGIPIYPYQLKDKTIKAYQEYPEINDLIEIKKFYDEVKAIEIVKQKETELEKKQKVYNLKLAKKDRSKITDEVAYQKAIDKIVAQADKILTPVYDKQINLWKKYLKLTDKQLETAKDEFKKFYNAFIKDKTPEDIENYWNNNKKLELLDIKFKAMEALNFDIETVKLKYFSDTRRTWIINDKKLFEIEVVFAGGYNIQRLHTRTYVKLKNL